MSIATITFNQPLLVLRNISVINSDVLHLKVMPGPDSEPELLNINSWSVKSFTKTDMKIAIVFENPLYISKNNYKDDMKITFLQPEYFISEESYQSIK